MAFTVKIKDDSLKRVEGSMRNSLTKVLNSPAMAKELGEVIISDIQFQTRKSSFKPLTEDWIKERKQIAKATPTHQAYSPRRSNLTLTGQLLDSLKLVSYAAGKYLFKFVGDHKPYKAPYVTQFKRGKSIVNTGRSGLRTIGEPIKNEKLAEYVQDQGRKFVKIRKELTPRLQRIIMAYIRRSSRALGLFK
jgi:hypothetical protein